MGLESTPEGAQAREVCPEGLKARDGCPEGPKAREITYYTVDETTAVSLEGLCRTALAAMADESARQSNGVDWAEALAALLRLPAVEALLLHVARVRIFNEDLHRSFAPNLELLSQLKKLKYWLVLPQASLLQCFSGMAAALDVEVPAGLAEQAEAAITSPLGQKRVGALYRRMARREGGKVFQRYLDLEQELEKAEPHAVYPTSTYRACDGQVLATGDASHIEGVMSTTITTTIRILTGVLDAGNLTLRDMYAPLGRCMAVVDAQVDGLYGERLDAYFAAHKISLTKLVCSGMEAEKGMHAVEEILKSLKGQGVMRNEPVLIVGGGVIADIGGLATALYDRNTPYVMLCTSIVAGIDAGPSPRTCCNHSGYKNLYGAYHPPVLTLTDRTLWSTLHEGWLRHGIAEIIKMAVVKDAKLFALLEEVGPRLIYTKFGTLCPEDEDFNRKCDLIVGMAMHSYVQSEYGNLWETHQCRPHAYGHTWSPGYEIPAGMLHGHAVATCMGFGAFLATRCGFIVPEQLERIMRLLSKFELSLWHPIMGDAQRIWGTNKKIIQKRGGHLCAPVPRGEIGQCGYIQDLTFDEVETGLQEYQRMCEGFPRGGLGVDAHCRDVGLEDPSAVADHCMAPATKDEMTELREENSRLRAKLDKLAAAKERCYPHENNEEIIDVIGG